MIILKGNFIKSLFLLQKYKTHLTIDIITCSYRIKCPNEDNKDTQGLQPNFNTDVADSYSPPIVENMDISDPQKNKVNRNRYQLTSNYYLLHYVDNV